MTTTLNTIAKLIFAALTLQSRFAILSLLG